MLHRLILRVSASYSKAFQHSGQKHLGGIMPPSPCQIGLRFCTSYYSSVLSLNSKKRISKSLQDKLYLGNIWRLRGGFSQFWELLPWLLARPKISKGDNVVIQTQFGFRLKWGLFKSRRICLTNFCVHPRPLRHTALINKVRVARRESYAPLIKVKSLKRKELGIIQGGQDMYSKVWFCHENTHICTNFGKYAIVFVTKSNFGIRFFRQPV